MSDCGDDDFQLSSDTLQVLLQFKNEQRLREERLEELQETRNKLAVNQLDMNDFKEDWQMSQFWYTLDTSINMATEAINATSNTATIGCISSPSAFLALKKISIGERKIFVFEIDSRFNIFDNEYVHYDLNNPLELNDFNGTRPLLAQFDYLIVDPPFLASECFEKMSKTIDRILKPDGKIMFATSVVMNEFLGKRLGCYQTAFNPKHRNGLSNEYVTFINYQSTSDMFVKV